MSVRISPGDEAALDWYFGPGQAVFERSTMGGMLDRAELFSLPPELMRVTVEITARPTGHPTPGGGYSPDEGALGRYAWISRFVARVRAQDGLAADVLGAYYGDAGARWGRTPHGRIFALFPLTEGGRELLRRARKRTKTSDQGLSAADELAALFDQQRVQPMPARAVLAEQARREAQVHYAHACALWVRMRHE